MAKTRAKKIWIAMQIGGYSGFFAYILLGCIPMKGYKHTLDWFVDSTLALMNICDQSPGTIGNYIGLLVYLGGFLFFPLLGASIIGGLTALCTRPQKESPHFQKTNTYFPVKGNLPRDIARWFESYDPTLRRIVRTKSVPRGLYADLVKEAEEYSDPNDVVSKQYDEKINVLKICANCYHYKHGDRTCAHYMLSENDASSINEDGNTPIDISHSQAKIWWCDAWKDEDLLKLIRHYPERSISYYRRHPDIYVDPKGKEIFLENFR